VYAGPRENQSCPRRPPPQERRCAVSKLLPPYLAPELLCQVDLECFDIAASGQIGRIVNVEQTGFLAGRSITENFMYAIELVQT
jgi:hypothetical protein